MPNNSNCSDGAFFLSGLYSSVAYTPAWLILQCGLYSSVAYTPVWPIVQCGFLPSAAYTPVWLILQCGLYSSVAYTPMWLIYSSVAYTLIHHSYINNAHQCITMHQPFIIRVIHVRSPVLSMFSAGICRRNLHTTG